MSKRDKENFKRPTKVSFLESDPGTYKELWRECERVRSRARYHNECICPKSKKHLCDGDCLVCDFYKSSTLHLSDEALSSISSDTPTPEERLVIKDTIALVRKEIVSKYGSVYMRIFEMKAEGVNERDISERFEIPRTTMRDNIKRIREHLKKKFGDDPF